MGKPVAFDARADERDVLGFISMTITLSDTGSWANCTFVPPITPMCSTILYAYSSSLFWRLSEMVSIGAVQKESPV